MRKFYLFLLVCLSSVVFGQTYKEKMSKEICACAKGVEKENKSQKQLEMDLGICLLKSAMPYSSEIKRDYGVDLKKDVTDEAKMGKLGEEMGMLMITDCPEFLSSFMSDDELEASDDSDVKIVNGIINKIENDNFVVFYLMGDNRILSKYYWVSTIESDIDLPKNYKSLLNKRVTMTYYTSQIFDARINDYRSLDILSTLRTD